MVVKMKFRNFLKKIFYAILIYNMAIKEIYAISYNEPITMDSRIKTYIYNQNEVFPIILHHGYHSHIDFPKSEFVQNIIIGNPVDWDITNRNNQIFLQTYSHNAHTNMTVITNKRTYEFDLIARNNTEEADYELAYAIRFYYPEDNVELVADTEEGCYENYLEIDDIIKGRVNANYIFYGSGDTTPIVAFNDARFTYLKFKEGVKIPKIETFERNNRVKKAKIFYYNGYVIIDNIFPEIRLFCEGESVLLINKAYINQI